MHLVKSNLACEFERALDNTAAVLLEMAQYSRESSGEIDFVSLVNHALVYLQHTKFQQGLITHGALYTCLIVLAKSYPQHSSDATALDKYEVEVLQQLRSNFNQVLSVVSALPEFRDTIPIMSPFISSLCRQVSSPCLQLQLSA